MEPDLSEYAWKDEDEDEDEYAHGRRLGFIDDAVYARVDDARQQVLALIHPRQEPFAEDWSRWRCRPDWPLLVLQPTP